MPGWNGPSEGVGALASVYLSAGHESFRAEVRDLLAAHVGPVAEEWERDRRIPRRLWPELARHELLGLAHPKSVGGTDRDIFSSIVLLEELGRTGYGGLKAAVAVHCYMATHYLARAASEELQARYLAPAIRGEMVAALAVTEPGAGSDLSRLSTTAVRDGDHFVVTGRKTMVTNGTTANFYVTAVRTTPSVVGGPGVTGVSLLVADADLPGITTSRLETMGWRCADTAEVGFDAVRVPVDRLIGRLDSGFYYLMRGFQLERLVAAVMALGGADGCVALIRRQLLDRQVFGGRLGDLQAVRHRLADLVTDLEASRQLVYHAAWCYQSGDLPVAECSMAKLHVTELACRIADAGLQLHGAEGYLDGSDISRYYRDARAATMAAGPSEVMRDIVANGVLGQQRGGLLTP
jgi:acyl-CoA dehydrogenase